MTSTTQHPPTHGYTRGGHPVLKRTMDHLPAQTGYQRFNKSLAVKITAMVGTMTCSYIFAAIAFFGLPPALGLTFIPAKVAAIVLWVSSEFIQLVLLAVIMVGQDVQSKAADVRAEKTFEDTERLLSLLDVHTEGGLKILLDAINSLKAAP